MIFLKKRKRKKTRLKKKKKNLAESISSKCPLEGDICFTIIFPLIRVKSYHISLHIFKQIEHPYLLLLAISVI